MTSVTYRRAGVPAAAAAMLLPGCGGDMRSSLPSDLEAIALDTIFEIGAEVGESWESFGGIWDVEAAPDGRLAVLDLEAPAVHVYDSTGRHLGSVEATGLGPGQLDTPSGIAWSRVGELLVWDPGSSWISRFRVGGSGVSFEDRYLAFAFGETGFCASRERSYLSYFQDGQVVHEVGPDGPVRSFGSAPGVVGVETLGPELQEIAVEELTPSALLCAPDGVLEVSFMQSQVRLFDWDGGLLWARELEGFRPVHVYTPDGMGLGRGFDEAEGSHLLRSVVAWGDDMALLQYELRTQEIPDEGEVEVIESRLVRLADGEEVARTWALPPILAARDSRLYLVQTEPFAKVIAVAASRRLEGISSRADTRIPGGSSRTPRSGRLPRRRAGRSPERRSRRGTPDRSAAARGRARPSGSGPPRRGRRSSPAPARIRAPRRWPPRARRGVRPSG